VSALFVAGFIVWLLLVLFSFCSIQCFCSIIQCIYLFWYWQCILGISIHRHGQGQGIFFRTPGHCGYELLWNYDPWFLHRFRICRLFLYAAFPLPFIISTRKLFSGLLLQSRVESKTACFFIKCFIKLMSWVSCNSCPIPVVLSQLNIKMNMYILYMNMNMYMYMITFMKV
jgi:hypothetical protein